MQYKDDIFDSHEVARTSDGIIARRVAEMTGLTGNPSEMVYKALQDPRVPQRGNPHPTIPGLIADEISLTAIGPAAVRITVVYRSFNILRKTGKTEPNQDRDGSIRFNYGTVPGRTVFNNSGKQLSVSHTFENTDTQGNTVRTEQVQSVEVDIDIPVGSIEYVREETTFPRHLADRFRTKVNKFPIWGYPARTLLCKGITGESTNGGQSYSVSYIFEIKQDTYDATITFIDDQTGNPPLNLVRGKGIKVERVYEEDDFSPLGLNIPGR